MTDKPRTPVRRRRIAGERARATPPAPRPPAGPRPAAKTSPGKPEPKRRPERSSPAADRPAARRLGRGTYAWFVPLCVVALVAVALAVWFGYRDYRGGQLEDAREDAVAPAGQAVEALLSYRHDTLESELESEAELMTGSYADEYRNIFPEQARELTAKAKATVESTVLAAAPLECGDDCSPDRVDVLVYFDKTETVAGEPPDTSANRAVVSMRREDGTWLVDGIEVF